MFSFLTVALVVTGVTAVPKTKLTHNIFEDRTRIINGEEARTNEFKHQLALLRDGYHTCGASIIASNWALTAAHCVYGVTASRLQVAGNFTDLHYPTGHVISTVLEVIMGDNGGHLTCGNVLAGVASFGRNGCHTDGMVEYPSVYARATYFYNWINTNCDYL